MICYAGIVCEQNLMFCYEFDHCYYVLDFCQDQLGKRVWKVLLYDDVVCFLVVLDSIFETLAHIWATLRSLSLALASVSCLTVLSTVKRASSFDRNLRVPMTCLYEFPIWHWEFMKPCVHSTLLVPFVYIAKAVWS